MPILDTGILFAAANPKDTFHRGAKRFLGRLSARTVLGTISLVEFEVVLKSRGYTPDRRMEEMVLLLRDYPRTSAAVHHVSPSTFLLGAHVEQSFSLDYFDALIAAETIEHDGAIVSTDRAFDRIPGLRRISPL